MNKPTQNTSPKTKPSDKNETRKDNGVNSDIFASLRARYGSRLHVKTKSATPTISTGLPSLDHQLGGGWVVGAIHELFGDYQSGKSTMAFRAIAAAQRAGKPTTYIDADGKFDDELAKINHVDISEERLLYFEPASAELAFQFIMEAINVAPGGLVVLDTLPSLVTERELATTRIDVGDLDSELALVTTRALRNLRPLLQKNKTTLLIVNQARNRYEHVYSGNAKTPQVVKLASRTTPGGDYLKSASTSRVELHNYEGEEGKEGLHYKVHHSRNGVERMIDWSKLVGAGPTIDPTEDLVRLAVKLGVVSIAGSDYRYGEKMLGSDLRAATRILNLNNDVKRDIWLSIKEVSD